MKSFFIQSVKAQSFTSSTAKSAGDSLTTIENIFQFLLDRIGNWIIATIIVFFTFVIAKIVKKIVVDKMSDRLDEEHQDVVSLVERISYVSVLSVGITIALKVAGIDLTAIIAAVGFGIGFALRDLIMNFAAGIVVLLSRQFNIGDYININDTIGKVIAIQSRCTILQSLDGTKIIVPNADLFSKQVISYTTNTFRRIDVPVGVEYSTDLQLAMRVAMETMQKHPEVLKAPAPVVLLNDFGESSINLICRFWVESKSDWLNIKSATIMNLKRNFDQVNINIPFPIRTLYFANELQGFTRKHGEQKETPKPEPANTPAEAVMEDMISAIETPDMPTDNMLIQASNNLKQENKEGMNSTRTGEEFLNSIHSDQN